MPTWQQQEWLEGAIARVGTSEVLERAQNMGIAKDAPEMEAVREAGRTLQDAMRALRHATEAAIIKERGYPR